MPSITAKISIALPFRTDVKEGDAYDAIDIPLDNAGRVQIFPFESTEIDTNFHAGSYVNAFRNIKIHITLPLSGTVDFSERDQLRQFFAIADEYLNIFLMHCKTKGKQFWWHPIYLNDFNLNQIRYAVIFTDDHTAEILHEERGSTGGFGPIGIGINGQIWKKVKDDILAKTKPNIVDFYIEIARDALFTKTTDVLMINTAIALEIFISRFCLGVAQKFGKDNDPDYKSLINNKCDGFAIKYFKKILPYLTSKDLSREDRNTYQTIDYLFRVRNKIVHTGEAIYKDDSGSIHKVYHDESQVFFLAAMKLFEWIRSIYNDIAGQLKCFVDTNDCTKVIASASLIT